VTAQYAPTVLQTISNPDGTVSIIQVDPSNPIITLPDGTTAQVQGVATVSTISVQVPVVLLFTSPDSIELCVCVHRAVCTHRTY
jgi:nuclear respiratory factor 1